MAVEELYSSLNKLLDDICKFLADETNYKNLSVSARKQADELINRSKHQLQEIAKVTIQNNEYDGAYVNMEKEKQTVESSDEDGDDNIYSEVTVSSPPQNPFANLPAKEMSQDVKFGVLSWRCKIILKFEKMKRIYAGIHHNWLLIYSSDKDSKPLQTFNLQFCKAQNVPCKSGKNQSQDFELTTTVGEKKTYFFTALTYKDMLQWVAHINKCSNSQNETTNLVAVSEENVYEGDNTENIKEKEENNEDDEEEIYVDIKDTLSPSYEAYSKNDNKPPELPLRRSPKSPLPVPPASIEKNKQQPTPNYNPLKSVGDSSESSSSFSEDDEDDIYEEFVSEKNIVVDLIDKAGPGSKAEVEENKTTVSRTNSIQAKNKPATPVKPKFLREGSVRSKAPVILKK